MANTTTPGTSNELLARVDDGWRPFRELVRHVGRAGMDGHTAAGWTFHDLLAHIAGWHDLTARRLRVFRLTGVFPGASDESSVGIPAFANADEFNARLVSSHRLVGAEALVDELDATFDAVRSELAQLTDAQIHDADDRVIAVVAGNTYDHYAEHAAELEAR